MRVTESAESFISTYSNAKIQNFWIMQVKTERKMIKSVTRTLYIDGKLIEEYTQDPMADSELADIEQIAIYPPQSSLI